MKIKKNESEKLKSIKWNYCYYFQFFCLLASCVVCFFFNKYIFLLLSFSKGYTNKEQEIQKKHKDEKKTL